MDTSFIGRSLNGKAGTIRTFVAFHFTKAYTGRGTYTRCKRKSMGMAKKLSEDIADLTVE